MQIYLRCYQKYVIGCKADFYLALNMMDLVKKAGDSINVKELSRKLGCRIVEVSALRGEGVTEAAKAAIEAAKNGNAIPQHSFSESVEHVLAHIEEVALRNLPKERQRWYAIKIFERDEKALEGLMLTGEVKAHIEKDIQTAEKEMDGDAESIITNERYIYIGQILKGIYKKSGKEQLSVSDGGISIGTFMIDWMNDIFGEAWLQGGSRSLLESWGVAPWLVGIISDGILKGIGAVLGFVPQMLVLFLMLCILEDCGYMARIAFIMDRIFRRFGLSASAEDDPSAAPAPRPCS